MTNKQEPASKSRIVRFKPVTQLVSSQKLNRARKFHDITERQKATSYQLPLLLLIVLIVKTILKAACDLRFH